MAFRGQIFAVGSFVPTITQLYSCPNGGTAYIKFFHLHHSGVQPDTVMLYCTKSGLFDVPIGRASLASNESADVIDKDSSLTLSEGDSIKGHILGTASGLQYFISGGLET